MKEAGIQLPDEGSSAQRYNNRQMTFSEEIRKTFADICEQDFGLEIEREARDASQSGKTLATYQRDQARQELQKADELISRVRAETSLEALKKERISEEIAILEEKKSSLETALGRLKALFLPIKKFLKRLSGIQISSSRTALDELLLDSECVPAYDVLRELEGPNPI